MFRLNPLYNTDGYKVGHKAMLAPGTTKLYGTWIPRSTKHAAKGAWFEVKEWSEITHPTHDNSRLIKKSYNIYKDPVTDDGTKKSLKGLLAVDGYPDELYVVQECTPEGENTGLLQVIYEDGKFYNQTTFKEVRERLNKI